MIIKIFFYITILISSQIQIGKNNKHITYNKYNILSKKVQKDPNIFPVMAFFCC